MHIAAVAASATGGDAGVVSGTFNLHRTYVMSINVGADYSLAPA